MVYLCQIMAKLFNHLYATFLQIGNGQINQSKRREIRCRLSDWRLDRNTVNTQSMHLDDSSNGIQSNSNDVHKEKAEMELDHDQNTECQQSDGHRGQQSGDGESTEITRDILYRAMSRRC